MELWSDFMDILFTNEDFRYGFFWGISLTIGVTIVGWWIFFSLHAQWLKMRQFFEPIKKPGRLPTETGPSPASMLSGCMGRVFILVAIVALVFFLFRGR